METSEQFLSLVKARSEENAAAFALLHANKLHGVCIGLLRQELDTLIRLCYLWQSSTSDEEALRLMSLSINGQEWKILGPKGKFERLGDKKMVGLASHLGGWEQLIYNFGCKLIHLSNAHLYETEDPVALMSEQEQEALTGYLRSYHGHSGNAASIKEVIYYLPKVMEKLGGNVGFYVEQLEERFRGKAATR
jgi:hypothetical protein